MPMIATTMGGWYAYGELAYFKPELHLMIACAAECNVHRKTCKLKHLLQCNVPIKNFQKQEFGVKSSGSGLNTVRLSNFGIDEPF